jgi:hypothetical protein
MEITVNSNGEVISVLEFLDKCDDGVEALTFRDGDVIYYPTKIKSFWDHRIYGVFMIKEKKKKGKLLIVSVESEGIGNYMLTTDKESIDFVLHPLKLPIITITNKDNLDIIYIVFPSSESVVSYFRIILGQESIN